MNIGVAIIQKNNKFVFMQRANGDWTFPSGKQENGETLDETTIREAKEETGLDIEIVAHLGKRIIGDNTLHFNLCATSGGKLHLAEPDQFLSCTWKSASEILRLTKGQITTCVKMHIEKFIKP